jgi:heptaprenyl diphosphate synthase
MSLLQKAKLESVYRLVKSDLAAVDTFIETTLREGAEAGSLPLVDHVLASPGKRVRPVLVCLVFYALLGDRKPTQEEHDRLVKVASAIELIHMASLVHDDVIDDADVRRNQPSVKAKWGNPAAVAFGVYLYSISLLLIAEAGLLSVLSSLSTAVKGMCEGELFQLAGRHDYDLSKDEYNAVIKRKTADLFIAACQAGAYVANASDDQVEAITEYGYSLGMLFQISDDVLDILSDGDHLKKAIGQDLEEGQVTLPMIYLLDVVPADVRSSLRADLEAKTPQLDEIQVLMKDHDIRSKIQVDLDGYFNRANDVVAGLQKSKHADALGTILDFIFKRS